MGFHPKVRAEGFAATSPKSLAKRDQYIPLYPGMCERAARHHADNAVVELEPRVAVELDAKELLSRHKMFCKRCHFYKSIKSLVGSSIAFLSATRKVTASRPSIRRWS